MVIRSCGEDVESGMLPGPGTCQVGGTWGQQKGVVVTEHLMRIT